MVKPGMASHYCHLSTWKAEAERSKVECQPGLHSEILPQNTGKQSLFETVVCLVGFVVVFPDRFSLYRPGCAGTHSVAQAALELRVLPAFAS